MSRLRFPASAIAFLAVAACGGGERMLNPLAADGMATSSASASQDEGDAGPGVVYTLSNQVGGNAVLAFSRRADGSLTASASYPTGGNGSGAGLGSQNAVIYSPDGTLLFAVNAGSNSVSAFRVVDDVLTLIGSAPSGGTHPISLSAANGLLYVLNDGGSGNIAGLRYTASGVLTTIAGSSRALSSSASAPAQIQFTHDGTQLIVSEKGTNMIGTYNVAADGVASSGTFIPSAGRTPFGFALRDDDIIVSEAFGGAVNASTVSSYRVGAATPSLISAAVPTTETAACWVAVTGNGRFAYTANTGSGTITGFAVSKVGTLSILDTNGETAVFGAGTAPADLAVSHNSRFLYARNGGARAIGVARINGNGSLTVLGGGITGLPAGTVGLAAR
jgi:6-phosphogluconolactonase